MRVSVIIANRNDVAMLAITVRSALEELSAVPGGGEIVICDNSDPKYRNAVESVIPQRYLGEKVRLYWQNYPCLFTARETATRQAKGEYIFCVDSHVIFGHNTIIDAVHFMNRRRRQPIGFGSIPINWLCQHEGAAKHDMLNLHGGWGAKYEMPRRISWKGMPWICRREWFIDQLSAYGCLSEHRMAWGGGDMYLGVKSWLLGYENWAIPSRPIIHIGPLPVEARKFHRYRLYQESGAHMPCLGFLMAFHALGVSPDFYDRPEIDAFLEKRVGPNYRDHLPLAMELAEADRAQIAAVGRFNYEQLELTRPWESEIEYLSYFSKFKKELNTAKTIKQEDWQLLQVLVKQFNIKTVLEFGSGLSTILFDLLGLNISSYDTDLDYMIKVDRMTSGSIKFIHWDNDQWIENGKEKVDFAFVDGADPRKRQIEIAARYSRRLIVHDGYTPPTPKFIDSILSDWREIPVNSRRARLFERI